MNEAFKGVWIPKSILKMADLNLSEKLVLAHMVGYKDFFARDSTVAANLGMNLRTVERVIASLRRKGHIKGKWRTRKPTTHKCVINYANLSSPTTHKCEDSINTSSKEEIRDRVGLPETAHMTGSEIANLLYKQSGMRY
jgi:hypothetical protein